MRGKRFVHERVIAIKMRKRGLSIVVIERKLKINKSTLSGWFKNIQLSPEKRARLEDSKIKALQRARAKATKWHNEAKKERLIFAEKDAKALLSIIDLKQKSILELALAMLYWGEGFKKNSETSMGNSDPVMLNLFIHILRVVYAVPTSQMRCELFLRADQDPVEMKLYWSKALDLPIENFKYVSLDARTKGSITRPEYKGVCAVRCGNVAIARKLGNISRLFAESILRRA